MLVKKQITVTTQAATNVNIAPIIFKWVKINCYKGLKASTRGHILPCG